MPDHLGDGPEVFEGDVALGLGVVELKRQVEEVRRVRLPLQEEKGGRRKREEEGRITNMRIMIMAPNMIVITEGQDKLREWQVGGEPI